MVNKEALRSKMRKKQGNKMILCIVAVCEFIGLIVYFTVRKVGKVFEITDISKILDLLRMAVGNLVLSILPAIATLLGLSFGSIVQKVLRARLNWKNRKVVKYRLIKINEVVNYKEDVWNYFRYILETIGIVSCIGIWGGNCKVVYSIFFYECRNSIWNRYSHCSCRRYNNSEIKRKAIYIVYVIRCYW